VSPKKSNYRRATPTPAAGSGVQTRCCGLLTTAFLSVSACSLAVLLLIAWRRTSNSPETSPSSALGPSAGIDFDKVILDDHASGVRVANVQVVDLDRDGRNGDRDVYVASRACGG